MKLRHKLCRLTKWMRQYPAELRKSWSFKKVGLGRRELPHRTGQSPAEFFFPIEIYSAIFGVEGEADSLTPGGLRIVSFFLHREETNS